MTGTFINMATVILGGLLGMLFGAKLPERVRDSVLAVLGLFTLALGVSMFLARKKVVMEGQDLPYSAFTAGITMSALNPFFLLWWATVGSLLILRFSDFGLAGLGAFTLAHWLCDLVWLSLVSLFIHKTNRFLGQRFQEGLFISNSVFLAVFGIYFILSGIRLIT